MVGAEDLGEEGPEGDQGCEYPVAEPDTVFLQDAFDRGRVEQVVEGELGRVAKLINLAGNPVARTLGHRWPPWSQT
jgi:hypothetical protein